MTSILALGVLAATPVLGVQFDTNKASATEVKVLNVSQVDQKFVNAAKKAIEQHSNGKVFNLNEVEKIDDRYYFQAKMSGDLGGSDAYVHVDAKTGEVTLLRLRFNVAEVTGPYKKYLETAQSGVKQVNKKSTFQMKEMNYYLDKESNVEFFQFFGNDADKNDKQYIKVHPKTNKMIGYQINFNLADVDKAIISAAEKAVKSMPNTTFEPFTSALLVKDGDAEGRWVVGKQDEKINHEGIKVVNSMKSVYAVIGEKSGKVYRVKVVPQSNNSKHVLTNDQVKSMAQPLIKNIMGIDISNYQLDADKSWLEYQFSSKGKANIHVNFSGNQIYDINLDRDNNTWW